MKLAVMLEFFDEEKISTQPKFELEKWVYRGGGMKKREGGFFAVTRLLFCLVDFLGAVYCGYSSNERGEDEKKKYLRVARTWKAERFMLCFFEPKEIYKVEKVKMLYEMYRHGLVHLYQPKVIWYSRNENLDWGVYSKAHKKEKFSFYPQGELVDVSSSKIGHLNIVGDIDERSNIKLLTICIDNLCDDFEYAVNLYRERLKNEAKLQENWVSAVNAICEASDI